MGKTTQAQSPANHTFDTICSFPLESELFAQAVHKSEPLVAVGLASGHVQTLRLPDLGTDGGDEEKSEAECGYGTIETAWRTRRHKGSCRCLGWSTDGESLYSAGTDLIVKAASAHTGKVHSKILLPNDHTALERTPLLLHALSPQTFLVATEDNPLYVYDLRANGGFKSSRPQQTYRPHDEHIYSLTPLPPTAESASGTSKQWVTTGGSQLAVTDLRKGVISRSEDQEDHLMCSTFVGGLPAKGGRGSEKVVVGGTDGVMTLWPRGVWDDQTERIIVDRDGTKAGKSLESLAIIPEDQFEGRGKVVAVGMEDGRIKLVKLGPNKVVDELSHDDIEGIWGLGVDIGGRLISGGGPVVKVWTRTQEQDGDVESEEETVSFKRSAQDDISDDENEDDKSDEEAAGTSKRKKRKKSRSGAKSNGNIMAFKDMS